MTLIALIRADESGKIKPKNCFISANQLISVIKW